MMKKVLRIVTNKYFLTAFAFVIWTLFFDQNDWLTLQRQQRELNGVKSNIAYLNNEIVKMNRERDNLLTNPQKLEAYAREHFRMKHEGEDVYVIEK